jgi:hypothetical protein
MSFFDRANEFYDDTIVRGIDLRWNSEIEGVRVTIEPLDRERQPGYISAANRRVCKTPVGKLPKESL